MPGTIWLVIVGLFALVVIVDRGYRTDRNDRTDKGE